MAFSSSSLGNLLWVVLNLSYESVDLAKDLVFDGDVLGAGDDGQEGRSGGVLGKQGREGGRTGDERRHDCELRGIWLG